ncbi:MAG: glycosyl hydrolase 2 galactose-binding domain-containing protein [Candidatus Ratteibacteria bacterium]
MKKISLNGIWILKNKNLKISAKVPSEIHIDLKKAKIIEEPFLKRNLFELRKYEGKKWQYLKEFTIEEEFLEKFKKVEIYFGGIDTHSEIFLNDKKIGKTNNAFIPHIFDITNIISRKNKIRIEIDDGLTLSPEKVPEKYIDIYHKNEDMRRLFIRKPQFVFGWDWTERIITCGLWRGVYLNFYENIAIRNIWVKKWKNDKIEIEIEVENFNEENIKTEFIFEIENNLYNFSEILSPGINIKNFQIALPFIKLWYPYNVGQPFLYSLSVKLKTEKVEDSKNLKFGLRKVNIIQDDDGDGKSFIFEINGKKVFCKGANWVPPDTIFQRVSKNKYKKLIEFAIKQKFNMLRVWGGGVYEDEYFYNLCDEKGIMLWHDFMFACGYYPDDNEKFMKNVENEVITVIKELRNHPSIVIWCGNNENYTIYYNEKKKNPDKTFYGRKIFEELIPEKIEKFDPERIYWPSSDYSPSGDDPKSMKEGDRHSWYIPDLDLEKYKERGDRYFFLQDTAKFVSEFGRLAFSPSKTINKFTKKRKVNFLDDDFIFHLNTFEKVENIIEKLTNFFGERIKKLSEQDIIKISQMLRGEVIEFALKYYASRKYKTSGSLFWMYNDSWPTSSSWTTVDYYLNKTPLFWYVKRAFSDLIVFIRPDFILEGKYYSLYLVNHSLNKISTTLTYGISNLYGNEIYRKERKIEIPSDCSILVDKDTIPELNNDYIIYAYTAFENKIYYDIQPVAFNFKDINLPEEKIEIKKDKNNLILKSNVFHICVKINGDVDDNYFSLIPNVPYKVKGRIKEVVSFNKFLQKEE